MKNKRVKVALEVLNYVIIAVLSLMVLFQIIMMAQRIIKKDEMPLLLGFTNAVVVSDSMEPKIKRNDMIIIREKRSYNVGDAIVYKASDDMYITHRVTAVTNDGFITRGDAIDVDDPEVLSEMVIGKVVLVLPKAGHIANFLQTPFGMLTFIIIGILVFKIPSISEIIQNRKRKNEKRRLRRKR